MKDKLKKPIHVLKDKTHASFKAQSTYKGEFS